MNTERGERGFSLIELLMVLALFSIVIMMSTDTFSIILRQSTQESKVVGSQVDSIVGLNIMRSDIEHAGYGLPWSFQNTITYNEADASPANTFNDSPNPPRAITAGNGSGYNGSDYMVIKSTAAGTSETSQKWTYIIAGQNPKTWDSSGNTKLNLSNGDRVIVIKPRTDPNSMSQLVMDASSSTFFTQYNSGAGFASAFSPKEASARFLIYGVDPTTDLRMPFNRADYYVSRPSSNMPASCAPNTGILYKGTVNHSDGARTEMPIIDCVADLQVIFGMDTNSDGVVDSRVDDISSLNASQIRGQVREVRVYILAQQGQRDPYYTHANSVVTVGEFGLGRDFNLAGTIGTGWQNYRWKLYTLVVRPSDLGQ
jgi:prepilin-type N-terminal cleavage/methylation domain-containing protein